MSRGDERALAELYDRYGAAMFGLARAITGHPSDAEEVVADAFGQAWRLAESFDSTRAGTFAWLAMLTRSRALDIVRARHRRERVEGRAARATIDGFALPVASLAALPDRHAELLDLRTRVESALSELPPEQRRVVELAYFGGLTHSEIARETATPLGTVKTRLRAAMEKLRVALAAYMDVG